MDYIKKNQMDLSAAKFQIY